MIAYANQTSWPTMFVLIAMILSYASLIHLVVSGFSCDPRIRKGCGLDPLTDTTPWFFSRTYRRFTGRVPPAWLPWAFAIFFYCSVALLAEVLSACMSQTGEI